MQILIVTLIGLAFITAGLSIVLGRRVEHLRKLQAAQYVELMKQSYSLLQRSKPHLPTELQQEVEEILSLLPSPTGEKEFRQGMTLYPGESAVWKIPQ